MPVLPSINPCDKQNSLVNRHIGTAFDTVKIVADNIEEILAIGVYFPYLQKYLGPLTSAPTQRPDGTPLQNGDYYFDSVEDALIYYDLAEDSWLVVDPNELLNARNEAVAAKDAALISEINASQSASAAATSELNASNSEISAANSATNAAQSEAYVNQVVTTYQANSVADMVAGTTVSGLTIVHSVGQIWSTIIDNEPAQYQITAADDYPRIDLGNGLFASRKYLGNTLKMNTIDWRMVEGGYRKPFTGEIGSIVSYEPYTQQEYDNAFWNAKSIQLAVEYADDHNISTVITPEGEFTVCYHSPSATSPRIGRDNVTTTGGATSLIATCRLESIKKVRLLDITNTHLKVIFDSSNRNPYDYAGILAGREPYQMPGAVFDQRGSEGLYINGSVGKPVVGDVYTRDWVNEGSQIGVEQTYGIIIWDHCYDGELSVDFDGFTGDGVNAKPRGTSLASIDNLAKGGFTDEGVEDNTDVTRRRSDFIDVSAAHYDTVITATSRYTRYPSVRNLDIGVFFYDENQNFLAKRTIRHLDDINVNGRTKYLRFEFYDDERTDAVVDYGSFVLVTGFSGRFYIHDINSNNNRRGGFSNLPNDTRIENVSAQWIGDQPQIGTPTITEPTRYFINQEDVVVRNLQIDGEIGLKTNYNGILLNPVSATVRNCDDRQTLVTYSAIKDLTVNGLKTGIIDASRDSFDKVVKFSNCEITDRGVFGNVSEVKGSVHLSDSYINGGRLQLYKNCHLNDVRLNAEGTDDYAVLVLAEYPSSLENVTVDIPETLATYRTIELASNEWLGQMIVRSKSNAELRLYPDRARDENAYSNFWNVDAESTGVISLVCGRDRTYTSLATFNYKGRFSGNQVYTGNLSTPRPYHYKFHGVSFEKGARINRFERGDGGGSTTNEYTFINCNIDVEGMAAFFSQNYAMYGTTTLDIKFLGCTFYSSGVSTNFELVKTVGDTTNITSEAVGCSFINCTNIDTITTVS